MGGDLREVDGKNMQYPSTIEIFGEVERETDTEVLFSDGWTDEAWLPKSQISYEPLNKHNQTVVTMPIWLAKEKGLI